MAFDSEGGKGVVLSWGGGGGSSKLCRAFLKRGRSSTYLWGLHRRRGRYVFKIWISRLPERTKKNQHVQFLRHHFNWTVFPSYSRVSQIKATRTGLTNSKIPEDVWFNSLYLKLRFTFAGTNCIRSTDITSDHVVSITQTRTLLVLLTLILITIYFNFIYNLSQELLNKQYWIDRILNTGC